MHNIGILRRLPDERCEMKNNLYEWEQLLSEVHSLSFSSDALCIHVFIGCYHQTILIFKESFTQ